MASKKLPLVKIGELCRFSNGHGFTPRDWRTSGLPIIRIQNLNGSKQFNYFQGKPNDDWLVNPGDLLFAWAGVKGVSFGPTIWNGPVGVLNQHIYKVHPVEGVNKQWLLYALKYVTIDIEKKAHGFKTSLVHVHKLDITGASVPRLGLSEQSDIADLISTWDQTIEKTERIIVEKQRYLSVLRQTLLTGKRRINGNRKKWNRYKLSDVLIEHGTLCTGSEDVYSVSVHNGLINQIEHLGRSFAAKDLSNYNLVNPGDVVYTKSPTGEFPYGIIKQSQVDSPVVVSPLYGVFTPRTWQLGAFLHHYFDSPVNTRNYLRPIIQKGAKNTINITNKTFLSGILFLPTCDDETMNIVEILNMAQQEINLLKKQADAYRRQKRGLMQKLLTGQWRVRTKDGG